VARERGDQAAARAAFDQARRLWGRADPDLAELKQMTMPSPPKPADR
jgi:hypothetical protein